MNTNSNLALAETQEPSPISIYSSGKHHRMHAKTINPFAAFLVGKLIEVATRVENSENVYWFYADDSDKVVFAIRQSDNLVHLALKTIGMGQQYWEHYYYNLGKRLVSELVAAVEAKMVATNQDTPAAPFLVLVEKPKTPKPVYFGDLSMLSEDGRNAVCLELVAACAAIEQNMACRALVNEVNQAFQALPKRQREMAENIAANIEGIWRNRAYSDAVMNAALVALSVKPMNAQKLSFRVGGAV